MTDTTPRPWLAYADNGSWWVCTDDGQHRVAYVGHTSSPNAAGDAHLIEVACNAFEPLAAALKALLNCTTATATPCRDCKRQARTALNMALGETP